MKKPKNVEVAFSMSKGEFAQFVSTVQRNELWAQYRLGAEQLASSVPIVRMTGVYSISALAAKWQELGMDVEQQMCVDTLCAYARLGFESIDTEAGASCYSNKCLTGCKRELRVQALVTEVIAENCRQSAGSLNWAWYGSKLHLHGASLRGMGFASVNFVGADLSSCDLRGSDLRTADLSLANLDEADLSECALKGSVFSGASMKFANLMNSDLRDVAFTEACLDGANLAGADLSGSDLSSANISDVAFDTTLYSSSTKWPSGIPNDVGLVKMKG